MEIKFKVDVPQPVPSPNIERIYQRMWEELVNIKKILKKNKPTQFEQLDIRPMTVRLDAIKQRLSILPTIRKVISSKESDDDSAEVTDAIEKSTNKLLAALRLKTSDSIEEKMGKVLDNIDNKLAKFSLPKRPIIIETGAKKQIVPYPV